MKIESAQKKCPFAARGIILHEPASISPDVKPSRIAPGVEIFPGCRISGAMTSIGPGCRIGREGPAVLVNCRLGRDVYFGGGFAEDAVLLDGVSIASGAHLRPGTLLEEHASCAHAVGLKQTVLMPWVTVGSLVNFCDCLMAGGTGPQAHGEVGSSYVHFNFTPRQDKATASLIGDVPRGVLLNQPPIFLGGQGGLVGPIQIAYGSVVAAGTICRRDVLSEGLLVLGQTGGRPEAVAFTRSRHGDLDRIVSHAFRYAGNLHALAAWYRHVRIPFAPADVYAQACLDGALRQLAAITAERCKQLDKVADRIEAQPSQATRRRLAALRPRLPEIMGLPECSPPPPASLNRALVAAARSQSSHIELIRSLSAAQRRSATVWLTAIVESVEQQWKGSG